MAEFKLTCPACGQPVVTDTSRAGETIPCPACHTQVTVHVPDANTAPPSATQAKTSALAVASLELACLGFLGITAVAGLVLGIIALKKIKTSDGQLEGRGFAIAGIAINLIFSALLVLAIPTYMHVQLKDQQTECINNLRQIDGAKQQWALEVKAPTDAIPTLSDIQPYLGRHSGWAGLPPTCPADPNQTFTTSYNINNLQAAPTCRIHPGVPGDSTGHRLE